MINPAFIASLEPLSIYEEYLRPKYWFDRTMQSKYDRKRNSVLRSSLAGLELRNMFLTVHRLIKRNTNKLFSDVFIGYVLPNFWKIRGIMGYNMYDVNVTYSDIFKTIVDLTYKYNLHCSLKDPKEIFRKMFSE
jgi:hypothetical protein